MKKALKTRAGVSWFEFREKTKIEGAKLVIWKSKTLIL